MAHMNNGIKIITIKPKGHTLAALVAALNTAMLDCRDDGHMDIDVCINEDTRALEIHAIPVVELQTKPTNIPSSKRDEAEIRHCYNRIQTTKYNAALRNYKRRKR